MCILRTQRIFFCKARRGFSLPLGGELWQDDSEHDAKGHIKGHIGTRLPWCGPK